VYIEENYMKFISGKKMSMTQVWEGDKVFAVTPVQAGPCQVTQVKTKATDGYDALQLAYGNRKKKNVNKPQIGHFKNMTEMPAHVREFRTSEAANFKVGDVVSVDAFAAGDVINVTGISKGKGFQGVVKRHGFHGFRKTHGNKDQERMPGSIGPKGPARVFPGTRMGGRMGGERITTTNLEVISVDTENNILFIKGAVPGAINGLVMINGLGELKVNTKVVAETKTEEVKVEVTEEVKEAATEEVSAPEAKAEETPAEAKVEEPKVEEAKTEEIAS
jgi:large subunit ribosomal protein L3